MPKTVLPFNHVTVRQNKAENLRNEVAIIMLPENTQEKKQPARPHFETRKKKLYWKPSTPLGSNAATPRDKELAMKEKMHTTDFLPPLLTKLNTKK